jgi:hypothetical protein
VPNPLRKQLIILGVVLAVLGVLALVAGITYLSEAAGKLPSFMPGHVKGALYKRKSRGTAGVVAGVVLFLAAAVSVFVGLKPAPVGDQPTPESGS